MIILIGADIVPTQCNIDLFVSGDKKSLLDNGLEKRLSDADYFILNLETPLSDRHSPIQKFGPNLVCPTKAIKGLKAINPYFYTLANNHMMDQGREGLMSTFKCLDDAGIEYCGAGENINQLEHSFYKKIGEATVGIYCCAEHEFSIARENEPGVNPFDPLYSFDHVRELSNKSDYTIVLYHGGKEYFRYPSPRLQQVFRKFADSGANLVIAQHTHCIGCKEEYNGASLVYGQGNFLFSKGNNEYWNSALLLSVQINKDFRPIIEYIPIVKEGKGIREASAEEKQIILEEFDNRSKEILDRDILTKKYSEFSENKFVEYAICYSGNSIVLRVIKKLFGRKTTELFLKKSNFTRLKDFIECEAHRELFLNALNKRI